MKGCREQTPPSRRATPSREYGETSARRHESTLERWDRSPKDPLVERAHKHIMEAEQFGAEISAPKGIIENPFYGESVKEDDEFFHITCHVDPTH